MQALVVLLEIRDRGQPRGDALAANHLDHPPLGIVHEDRHLAAEAEVLRIGDRQHQHRGHGCVDGVPAALQDRQRRVGRFRAAGGHGGLRTGSFPGVVGRVGRVEAASKINTEMAICSPSLARMVRSSETTVARSWDRGIVAGASREGAKARSSETPHLWSAGPRRFGTQHVAATVARRSPAGHSVTVPPEARRATMRIPAPDWRRNGRMYNRTSRCDLDSPQFHASGGTSMLKLSWISVALILAVASASCWADGPQITFKKLRLEDQFYAEGAYYADFNQDGKLDVVAGPFWYEGPDFQKKHEVRAAEKLRSQGLLGQLPDLHRRLQRRRLGRHFLRAAGRARKAIGTRTRPARTGLEAAPGLQAAWATSRRCGATSTATAGPI